MLLEPLEVQVDIKLGRQVVDDALVGPAGVDVSSGVALWPGSNIVSDDPPNSSQVEKILQWYMEKHHRIRLREASRVGQYLAARLALPDASEVLRSIRGEWTLDGVNGS